MSAPLVSAVVPTYGDDGTVCRAVQSVAAQTYEPIELVVVDDCSPRPARDDVAAVDTSSLHRVTVHRHESNQGASAARNTGIEHAEGEFVAFLDDDDEWRPTKIERQVDRYREVGDDVGAVYTGIEQVDADGRTNSVSTPGPEGWVTRRLLLGNFMGSFSILLADAESVAAAGELDERFPSWQDWEYYVRLSQVCAVAAVPEPLVVRHNEGDQISGDFDAKADVSAPLFVEKYRSLADEYGRLFGRRFQGRVAYETGYAGLRNRRFAAARRHMLRALAYDPSNTAALAYLLAAAGGGATYDRLRALKRSVVRLASGAADDA